MSRSGHSLRIGRWGLFAALILAGCVSWLTASSASAASIYQRSGGCNPAPCDDSDLVYSGGGENNVVLIQRLTGPSGPYFSFIEAGGGEITGAYEICTQVSTVEVTCPTTWDYGDEVATFDVDAELHGGTDSVDMRTNRPAEIDGGAGSDVLKGGSSNDTILGDLDFVTPTGPDGNDFIDGRGGADYMQGDGGGGDTVSYASRSTPVNASIDGGANDGGGGEGDNIATDVEQLSGSQGNDVLTGSAVDNVLRGNAGGDFLFALGGTDVLEGGDQDDDLDGGDGQDSLSGQLGLDELRGGAGNDGMDGGADNDSLIGDAGADDMIGGDGTDTANYGTSTAPLSVNAFDGQPNDGAAGEGDNAHSDIEILQGGQSNDTLMPIDGGEVWGGPGNDTLFGGGQVGNDRLEGQDGNDTLDGLWGADLMNGGAGFDTVDYTGHFVVFDEGAFGANSIPDGVDNDGNGWIDSGAGGSGLPLSHDNVGADIEIVIGSDGPDHLVGTVDSNLLQGRGANDTLLGDAAGDSLLGGTGDDALQGAAGNDALDGAAGNDALDGGTGADTIDGGADLDTATYATRSANLRVSIDGVANDGETAVSEGDNVTTTVENVRGGSGADLLTGGAGGNSLLGGRGDDVLNGGLGGDLLDGQEGVDTVSYAGRSDPIAVILDQRRNDGADPDLDGQSTTIEEGDLDRGIENANGGTGNDTMRARRADAVANVLRGGDGDDTLYVREGTATVDTLNCGPGAVDRFAKDPSDVEVGCEIALP